MRDKLLILLLFVVLLTSSCGGGEREPEADVRITDMPAVKSSTTVSGSPETLSFTANCDAGVSCVVNSATVRWTTASGQTITKSTALNKVINAKANASITITLLSDSDRVFAPLVYLKDDNPSKARTSYTAYSETIGDIMFTKTGLTGRRGCTADSTSTNCMRFEDVPSYDYTRGTMRFTNFVLSLQESTSLGTLTGDGNGLYNATARTWLLNFNKGIPEGSEIYAMYISPLRQLSNFPTGRDVKVYYDTLTLQQDSSDRLVSGTTVYGSVIGRQIEITRAMGFRNAPITASYSGDPIRRYGGELLGTASSNCRGNTCTFNLQKSIPSLGITALIKTSSLQVFTNNKVGSVRTYDPHSGALTVEFDPSTPLDPQEEISVSYVFSFLSIPVYVDIDTSHGKKGFVVRLEITRN